MHAQRTRLLLNTKQSEHSNWRLQDNFLFKNKAVNTYSLVTKLERKLIVPWNYKIEKSNVDIGEGNGNPLQYSHGKSDGQRSLVGYSP